MWRCRVTLRFYMLLLSLVYFTMLYIFHGRLQLEMSINHAHEPLVNTLTTPNTKLLPTLVKLGGGSLLGNREIKRRMLETNIDDKRILGNGSSQLNTTFLIIEKSKMSLPRLSGKSSFQEVKQGETCFLPSTIPNQTFQALDPSTFVYSAYLDERYTKTIIRIMAMFNLDKKSRVLKFFCTFPGSERDFRVKASVYELCENHGKMFGGYILSCDVPSGASTLCRVNVSIEVTPVHHQYKPPRSQVVTLAVTKLGHKLPDSPQPPGSVVARETDASVSVPYNFSICVPPLFGKIDTVRFVEFIELNRLLGFQHFIFYLASVENTNIVEILKHYEKLNIVTLVTWTLPPVTGKNKIWYNGQLNAHNDCLYRAMTLTRYLAIIDIDEFMVPHNGDMTVHNSIENAFQDTTCGLSFPSAFFDPKFAKDGLQSKLITVVGTGRSSLFSSVRTKVLVKPERIFEVGIHHISKPAQEWYKVVKMNSSTAFLHHYRTCVPNYGMKCSLFVPDRTMHLYQAALSANVISIMKNALSIDIELY